ncbi:MAG: M20/M25/M40 family metallo-hydrolase [Erysipelotrichales bacterium]|nr:M20/M25/M40 family metallo-hydrolase [Erysipelotrichales bacterium]
METKKLEELCNMIGVAGYEEEVRRYIKADIAQYGDEVMSDALGNLIVFKKGYGENKKKVMVSAHMDEVGFQVIKINENGTLTFKLLGFGWLPMVYMSKVVFENGQKGVIGCNGGFDSSNRDVTKLYIDLGVSTKAEAEKLVKIGDVATYDSYFEHLTDDLVVAKAIDDRVGCFMQMELLKDNKAYYNDVYFVFSTQEEVGTRGGLVAAKRISPEVGIAFDVTPSNDRPCDQAGDNRVGKGPALLISDPSLIADRQLVKYLESAAEACGEEMQRSCIMVGGSDAAAMNTATTGCKSTLMGIVIRYCHGPYSIISLKDVEGSIKIMDKFLDTELVFED